MRGLKEWEMRTIISKKSSDDATSFTCQLNTNSHKLFEGYLVGGFNPFEKRLGNCERAFFRHKGLPSSKSPFYSLRILLATHVF